MTRSQFELVVDARAIVGESPRWDPRVNRLWWVDIPRGELHGFELATGLDSIHYRVNGSLSCVALRKGGGLLLACTDRLLSIDDDGVLIAEIPLPIDVSAARLNDGACDINGRFYVGSLSLNRTLGSAQLFRVERDLSIFVELPEVTISNGLAFTPDGRTAYYVDTPTMRIDVFDVNPEDGSLSRRRPLIELEGPGRPDGLTLDSEGGIWVALWMGSEVRRYTPDGRLDRRLTLPVSKVTSCAFGGSDLSTLFVTTASQDLTDEERNVQPLAGGLFAADIGFSGLPSNMFSPIGNA